jgi:excisionase family DNA binding protein
MAEKLLRPREAAQIMNCSVPMIYKYVDSGLLPAVKIPAVNGKGTQKQKHMIRIKPKDLELFINSFHTSS